MSQHIRHKTKIGRKKNSKIKLHKRNSRVRINIQFATSDCNSQAAYSVEKPDSVDETNLDVVDKCCLTSKPVGDATDDTTSMNTAATASSNEDITSPALKSIFASSKS